MQSKAIETLLNRVKAKYAVEADLPPTLIDEPVTTLYKSFEDSDIQAADVDFASLLGSMGTEPEMGTNAETNIQPVSPFGD